MPIQLPYFQQKCIGIHTTPTANHTNKWESARLMHIYYVVEFTALQYPRFEVILNIISKVDTSHRVIIGYFLLGLHQNVLHDFGGKRKMGVPQTPLLCVHIFMQGLPQRPVYHYSNIYLYLQQGHATT